MKGLNILLICIILFSSICLQLKLKKSELFKSFEISSLQKKKNIDSIQNERITQTDTKYKYVQKKSKKINKYAKNKQKQIANKRNEIKKLNNTKTKLEMRLKRMKQFS